MKKLVSILVPAYNAEKWITDSIRSALAQTWPRTEIIIVDDGSTDRTLEIIRRFESRNVKVIHQRNEGACRARNRALEASQGEYIQWFDADDLLAPDKIERQMVKAEQLQDSEILFTASWGEFYYRPRKAKFRPTSLWADHNAVEWLVQHMTYPGMMPNMAWLVSRDITEQAGPWDERLKRNQDGEYFFRIVSHACKVLFIAEAQCFYRNVNPHSVSRMSSREALESLCLSYELETRHALKREESERIRRACINRLTHGVNMLKENASNLSPDLTDRLNRRIKELGSTGGGICQKKSKLHDLILEIVGERGARALGKTRWRLYRRCSRGYDFLMARIFGVNMG